MVCFSVWQVQETTTISLTEMWTFINKLFSTYQYYWHLFELVKTPNATFKYQT